jgi:hypothetical protein
VLRLKMRLAKLGIPESSYGLLTNKVVEWSIDRVNVRADDVLRELGLKDRFVDSLRQNFPVDIERLVPVPYLADAIDVALTSLPSGYHDHLWHAVEQDQIAVAILSLLAIRQDFTTTEDLLALLKIRDIKPTRGQVEQSLKTITHVLRISDAQG